MYDDNPAPIPSDIADFSNNMKTNFSQEELIELLQTTIRKLDLVVNQLNNQNVNNLPTPETIESLITSTNIIASSLKTDSETSKLSEIETEELIDELEEWEETSEPQEESLKPPIKEETKAIENENSSNEIPSSPSNTITKKSPKWTIIGFSVIIIAAIVSTSLFFLTQSSTDIKLVQIPSEKPETKVVEMPPQLEVPELPQPIKNAPPPEPKLTPEQSLIAAIQKEVTDLTHQYPEELIGRIEANFLGSRLTVTMGDEWYNLQVKQQDNLANTILERTQNLDFRKLELLDSQGTLIARSPVVGNQIIILQRHL
jgi:gas vesicle protein